MVAVFYFMVVLSTFNLVGIVAAKETSSERQGKLFTLFNVVSFSNTVCSAVSKDGTCYSAPDCTAKKGRSQGSCAAGFGVCCVFVVTEGLVSENNTYMRNLGFPSAMTNSANVVYTVKRLSNDVCSLRLDFETFIILGTTDSMETNGGTCRDIFTMTTTTGAYYPQICGLNSGQHVYVDLGTSSEDQVALTFSFSDSSSSSFSTTSNNIRIWDIKATQFACTSSMNPPEGCLQYFTNTYGTIKTFNFDSKDQTHLSNQRYSVCIRRSVGFCCVQYSNCNDGVDGFSINEFVPTNDCGKVDSECTGDFVQISGASTKCDSTGNSGLTTRICGTAFTTISSFFNSTPNGSSIDIPICDCSAPFVLTVRTDMSMDVHDPKSPSRGVCLKFKQLTCSP